MYLKSVRLEGFKSFANKTIFEFNKGITAIVGPNGSGKSNIVDAIRWVLGEQSVKSLRGSSQMSDVIFSGSETKEALNKASVTLTFDNTDKYLNTDYSEVEVKRCIYTTGESEYFLNNIKVRLKDIQDLFIDSGSGNDAFNIISQGTVTDIVNSRPIDRRIIFESAAGVLKYKKRKEESLRKLEKTKDNLASINLVISELDNTIGPLEKEAEIARKYVSLKDQVKEQEISITTKDITSYYEEYKLLKEKEESLQKRLDNTVTITNDNEIERIKLEIIKIDDDLNTKNKRLLDLTQEISNLDSEKRVVTERTKYEYSEDKLQANLINLKEEELNTIKEIQITNDEIDSNNKIINNKKELLSDINNELNNLLQKHKVYEDGINNLNKENMNLENKINILEHNISNNESVPRSIQNILNNTHLKGIHNTVGNIVTIPDEYLIASQVVMGASSAFLIVDDENAAKNAINYLKDNNLGRATFLPLNIIKSRYLSIDIKSRLEQINGYVGILSDLFTYNSQYQNIIENQYGNVIVATNIDSMNLIAKILEYKYRVVSLDGSIIYAGGSISGGTNSKYNLFNDKKELDRVKIEFQNNRLKEEKLKEELKEIESNIQILTERSNNSNSELINLNALRNAKINVLESLEDRLKSIKSEIDGINSINNNSIDSKLQNIMETINKLNIEKERLEYSINEIKMNKDSLNSDLSILEQKISAANSEYRSLSNELNQTSVSIGKINVKLDNLLLFLNEEYGLTYEYALINYNLDIDDNIVRDNVKKLKSEIKSLGEVNTGSISEYERLKERYDFLTNQRNDLEVSMQSLYSIIDDMDNIMTTKFKDTFNKVKEEFSKVFKIMFQGGTGKLELSDENDYLNTGVEMIIIPPGKKINNNQSLSGGEKSLAAICLLFSILNVSPVPFVVLDEVEAALDEANVDLFGKYLKEKKESSQYILITHKKRMMEYADVLYGITMQNAGISKVVGVKLEDM